MLAGATLVKVLDEVLGTFARRGQPCSIRR